MNQNEKSERAQVVEGTRNNATGEIIGSVTASRTDEEPATVKAPKLRGFAAISPERRAEIAARGGKAAHAAGTAHKFNAAEGRAAGQKGGSAPHVNRVRKPATP